MAAHGRSKRIFQEWWWWSQNSGEMGRIELIDQIKQQGNNIWPASSQTHSTCKGVSTNSELPCKSFQCALELFNCPKIGSLQPSCQRTVHLRNCHMHNCTKKMQCRSAIDYPKYPKSKCFCKLPPVQSEITQSSISRKLFLVPRWWDSPASRWDL